MHDGFEYPLDQDYEHLSECGTRLQGKLDECNCSYPHGIIGMEQPSCLVLQMKEQGIMRNQVSQSCIPEIIFKVQGISVTIFRGY